MITTKVLIVEDNQDIGQFLRDLLVDEGYAVELIRDGTEAIKTIERNRPDIVLLDLGLPNIGGETVCIEAKKIYPDLPVIMTTAKDGTNNIINGLDVGADDYLVKPFEGAELLARMKATLRAYHKKEDVLQIADLKLNNTTMEVSRSGKKITLTAQEFKLLEYLMNNKGRVLSRDNILNRIWDSWSEVETRVVDVYIGYLRKKIDANYPKKLIVSVRGFGYSIKD